MILRGQFKLVDFVPTIIIIDTSWHIQGVTGWNYIIIPLSITLWCVHETHDCIFKFQLYSLFHCQSNITTVYAPPHS